MARVCRHKHAYTRAHRHTCQSRLQLFFFLFLFRSEGEGAEEAWHVRSNLLSTVARSPVPVIWSLGQTLGTKLAAGRGRSTA